jgi:hypothetical protein
MEKEWNQASFPGISRKSYKKPKDSARTDTSDKRTRHSVICRLPGGSPQPGENGIFLDPFGARNAANAHTFRQQRQRFQDRLARRLASIEHCAIRFRECLSTALAPVALCAIPGFPEADDLRRGDLTVQLTCFVRAKLPHLSQFVRHVSLEPHTSSGSILPTTLVRETTVSLFLI